MMCIIKKLIYKKLHEELKATLLKNISTPITENEWICDPEISLILGIKIDNYDKENPLIIMMIEGGSKNYWTKKYIRFKDLQLDFSIEKRRIDLSYYRTEKVYQTKIKNKQHWENFISNFQKYVKL